MYRAHGSTFLPPALILIEFISVPVFSEPVVTIRSRALDIDYVVNGESQPLESVQLWVSTNDGMSWDEAGFDPDLRSPFRFQAPADGKYGFFFLLKNRHGNSSSPPSSGTEPQVSVVADETPPVIQLHPIRAVEASGRRILQVHWTAVDTMLTARPIEIQYQRSGEVAWIAATPEPISHTGRFDWRPPADVEGSIYVQVCVSDMGGHRTCSERQNTELVCIDRPPSSFNQTQPGAIEKRRSSSDAETSSQPSAARVITVRDNAEAIPTASRPSSNRVERLLSLAAADRNRGDYSQAVSRLREVVQLEPGRTAVFLEMASLLVKLGDAERALQAYDIVLKMEPTDRDALLGTAMVLNGRSDYVGAADRLRTLLHHFPEDAEAWLALGDVSVYQGDNLKARDNYLRATRMAAESDRVTVDAKKRLEMLSDSALSSPASRR